MIGKSLSEFIEISPMPNSFLTMRTIHGVFHTHKTRLAEHTHMPRARRRPRRGAPYARGLHRGTDSKSSSTTTPDKTASHITSRIKNRTHTNKLISVPINSADKSRHSAKSYRNSAMALLVHQCHAHHQVCRPRAPSPPGGTSRSTNARGHKGRQCGRQCGRQRGRQPSRSSSTESGAGLAGARDRTRRRDSREATRRATKDVPTSERASADGLKTSAEENV